LLETFDSSISSLDHDYGELDVKRIFEKKCNFIDN